MFTGYHDIISRISDPPTWWDEWAVPRYCAFEPTRCSDIHADEAVLIAIECQCCGRPYLKAYTQGGWARGNRKDRWLRDDIRDDSLVGGDPPNYCCSGTSMSATLKRVIEYWGRAEPEFVEGNRITSMEYFNWKRDPTYEIVLNRQDLTESR
jgi:hypothetical protein